MSDQKSRSVVSTSQSRDNRDMTAAMNQQLPIVGLYSKSNS